MSNNKYNDSIQLRYLIFCHRWQEVERLRAERNVVANKMKGKLEPSVRQALVEEGVNYLVILFFHP